MVAAADGQFQFVFFAAILPSAYQEARYAPQAFTRAAAPEGLALRTLFYQNAAALPACPPALCFAQ